MFENLLRALAENYDKILKDEIDPLIDFYRSRSMILGRDVTIHEDLKDNSLRPMVEGRVVSIGDQLELYLEGREKPIVNGRLQLKT